MRDARVEANDLVGGRFDARVLEPSPPARSAPPFFADDPVDPPSLRGSDPSHPVLAPVSGADVTWDALAADEPELAPYAAERWLGAWRPLEAPPPAFAATRAELHRLAAWVLAPARAAHHGKIGLRYTFGGFGTPFFGPGDGRQVRVAGTELVVQDGVAAATAHPLDAALEDLAAAAGVVLGEVSHPFPDVPPRGDPGRPLAVDAAASAWLGDWFGFACSVLEELRASAPTGSDAGRVQLWPEHFDAAVEVGSGDAGQRATYGASPGDAHHPEPYLYVAPWSGADAADDPYWNAAGFAGAELTVAEIVAAGDGRGQRQRALDFFRTALAVLGVTEVQRG